MFSKVDRTLKFDMTLLTTFEACEVVVILNLLGGFGEFSIFGLLEKFSKFSYHQIEILYIFLTAGTIFVFFF